MKIEYKTGRLRFILRILILSLISFGLHLLSIMFYAAFHTTRQMNSDIAAEAIITFCFFALWIGYFPSKRIWLKSCLAAIVVFLHLLSMPTF